MVLNEKGKDTDVEKSRDSPVDAVFDATTWFPYPFENYNGGDDELVAN
jgi:hypothetical protein